MWRKIFENVNLSVEGKKIAACLRKYAKDGNPQGVEKALLAAETLIYKIDHQDVKTFEGRKLPLLTYSCRLRHTHQVKGEIVAKILYQKMRYIKDIIIPDRNSMIPRTFDRLRANNQGLIFVLEDNECPLIYQVRGPAREEEHFFFAAGKQIPEMSRKIQEFQRRDSHEGKRDWEKILHTAKDVRAFDQNCPPPGENRETIYHLIDSYPKESDLTEFQEMEADTPAFIFEVEDDVVEDKRIPQELIGAAHVQHLLGKPTEDVPLHIAKELPRTYSADSSTPEEVPAIITGIPDHTTLRPHKASADPTWKYQIPDITPILEDLDNEVDGGDLIVQEIKTNIEETWHSARNTYDEHCKMWKLHVEEVEFYYENRSTLTIEELAGLQGSHMH